MTLPDSNPDYRFWAWTWFVLTLMFCAAFLYEAFR